MSAAVLSGPRAIEVVDPAACSLAFGPNDAGLCWWDGRAVPAHRYRWCSTGCEAAFDEAHVWPTARAGAVRRAAGRCVLCGSRDVEVHHDPPVDPETGYGPSCAHHTDRLRVLCHRHHLDAHRNLRAKPGTQLALFRAA